MGTLAGRSRSEVWRQAVRDALTVVGIAGLCILWAVTVIHGGGPDQLSYWGIDLGHLYGVVPWLADGAHVYAPAFYQVLAPLSALPYEAFVALWAALMLAALVWIVGVGPWLGVAVLWVGLVGEVQGGNIHLLLAVAIVAGFRYPAAWAFVLLTKPPLGVGLLWFAARREWRALAQAAMLSAAVAGVSFVVAPGLWAGWIGELLSSVNQAGAGATTIVPPLFARLPLAGALVFWGGTSDRRWTVPVAAVVASPLLTVAPAMLVALVPLASPRLRVPVLTRPALRARLGGRQTVARPVNLAAR